MRSFLTYVFDNKAEVDSLQFDVRMVADRKEFDVTKVMGGVGNRFDMFWVGVYEPGGCGVADMRLGWATIDPTWGEVALTEFTVVLQFRVADPLHANWIQDRVAEYFRTTPQFLQQQAWVRDNINAKL